MSNPDVPADDRGWFAIKLDFLFGVGWTKKVMRIGNLLQVLIVGVGAGSLGLNAQTKFSIPILQRNWVWFFPLCVVAAKVISWYQSENQAAAMRAISERVTHARE